MTAAPVLRIVDEVDDDLLATWEVFGVAAGWSPKTLCMRREALGLLSRHAGVPVEDVTALQLARFLASKRAPATKATYYRHVRSYFVWLHKMGHRADDPTTVLPPPREHRGAPKPVSTRQLEEALAVAERTGYCFIVLAAYAGLRIHEVAKIRGEDIDVDAGTLRVLGKGGVEAVIPLHPRIATAAHGRPRRGYWFPGAAGGHVVSRTVGGTIKATFARAGHDMHAHQLRHWFGTQLLRSSGGNLRVTQECMRHAGPATTARYALVEDSERTAAVRGLPG